MSTVARHNYRARPRVAASVARSVSLAREDRRFFTDIGAEPLDGPKAFELGLQGEPLQWRRRGGRGRSSHWVLDVAPPAIGLDCLPEYEAGIRRADALCEQQRER